MNYEKIALALLLVKSDFNFYQQLNKELFTTYNARYIYLAINKYVMKYNKLPTLQMLLAYLETNAPESNKAIILAYAQSLTKVDTPCNTEPVFDGLVDHGFINVVDTNIEALIEAASSKNIAKMKQLLSTLTSTVVFKDKAPKEARELIFAPEDSKMIESFMPTMRENNVAFEGVSLVSANSGAGKSIFAMQQAIYSYLQGKDVVCLNVELSQPQFIGRIIAHITGTPYKDVMGEKDPVKIAEFNEVYQAFFSRENKFKILNATLDASTIREIITVEKATGLDVLILDYIQLVENDADESWKFLTKFVKELHQLAIEHGVVILTPAQVNTDHHAIKKGDYLGAITTRGAKELELTSSLWMHIIQTQEEYAEGVCRLLTLKSRNAQKCTYVLETLFSKMKFADTGVSL